MSEHYSLRESIFLQEGHKRRLPRQAFSLTELIVVIAVISVVLGILVPVVQSIRESARNTGCKNHLRELGHGFLRHEASTGRFISGGWSPLWLGVAEESANGNQPGGWTYKVLPYIEQSVWHDSVSSVTFSDAQSAYQKLALADIEIFSCPSRRSSAPLTIEMSLLEGSSGGGNDKTLSGAGGSTFRFSSYKKRSVKNGGNSPVYFKTAVNLEISLTHATRSDYAANGGSYGTCLPMTAAKKILTVSPLPSHKILVGHATNSSKNPCVEVLVSWAAMSGNGHGRHNRDVIGGCPRGIECNETIDSVVYTPKSMADGEAWAKTSKIQRLGLPDSGIPDLQNGIVMRMGSVPSSAVSDGLGNVYLLGEKYVASDHYQTGLDPGDAGILYTGYSSSTIRWGGESPGQDSHSEFRNNAFGSAHTAGFNMVYGDGRVETVSFDIEPSVHQKLAGRDDGTP